MLATTPEEGAMPTKSARMEQSLESHVGSESLETSSSGIAVVG